MKLSVSCISGRLPNTFYSVLFSYKTASDSTEVNNTSVSKPNTQAKPEEVAMELIKMYIVKKGDTLYNISRRSGVSVEQLMSLNNMNNSNINLGQVLVIRE